MARKGVFPIVATLAVVGVVLAVFSQTVMRDSNISTNTMTTEQAYADLSGKMKRIGVQEVSVNPQQLDVSEFLDAKDELPDIDSSYPFVVEGNGDVNIEIFSSGEKAAESGSDSFLTSMAKKFNAQHNKTSGDKTMSVSLRSVPSGTAAEYISTGKYQPECYTPSNTLFGELVKNEGVELTVEADRLAGNVAGILVSKKTGDMLRSEYGEASVSSVLNATIDGKKWFVTEYYRTAPFNPDKETYDLYKAFAEAFRKNEMEEQEFQEELKKAVNKAYGNGLYAGQHSVDFG